MNKGAVKIILVGLAVLLALLVGTKLRERSQNAQVVRTLLDSVATMRQKQGVENAALQARFDRIDLDGYLKPAKLASTQALQDGLADLDRFRALLVERDQLAAAQVAQAHALLTALPRGTLRDQALQGEASTSGHNHDMQTRLSQAQNANADALQAVFDWANLHHHALHVQGDKLLVDGQQPLDELNTLQTQLRATGQTVMAAIEVARTAQSQSRRDLAKIREDLDK
jgi:hypothetical protein